MKLLLDWILSPLGRIAVVVGALVLWTAYQRDQAASRAREACNAKQLERTITEIQRQLKVAEESRADAEARQKKTENELKELEADRATVTHDLGDPGKRSCDIPDAATGRLSNIR